MSRYDRPEPQVPAERRDDDVGWELEAGKRRPRRSRGARVTGAHGRQCRRSDAAMANAPELMDWEVNDG
jgi:hypothetical protein